MVVDTDSLFVELLADLFAEAGYQMITCQHSGAAPTIIRREQPDLIVLDTWIEHPDSGLLLLELLRRVPATQAIPVLVCTADSWLLTQDAEHLRSLGCTVLPKPFDLDAFLTMVRARIAIGLASAVGV